MFRILFMTLLFCLTGCLGPEPDPDCTPGTEGCGCLDGTLCTAQLSCLSGVCVDDGEGREADETGDNTEEQGKVADGSDLRPSGPSDGDSTPDTPMNQDGIVDPDESGGISEGGSVADPVENLDQDSDGDTVEDPDQGTVDGSSTDPDTDADGNPTENTMEARCGDGKEDPDEQCDDGNVVTEPCAHGENSCTVCDAGCSLIAGVTSLCGDGRTDEDHETCDDQNQITEACAYGQSSCTVCDERCSRVPGATSVCGDDQTDLTNEECDDGNAITDDCPYGDGSCTVCGRSCSWVPGNTSVCGDGHTDDRHEQCDDSNTLTEDCEYGETSCTVCDSSCQQVAGTTAYCGDGTVDASRGEECDDEGTLDGDGCSASCLKEIPPAPDCTDNAQCEDGYMCIYDPDGSGHCLEGSGQSCDSGWGCVNGQLFQGYGKQEIGERCTTSSDCTIDPTPENMGVCADYGQGERRCVALCQYPEDVQDTDFHCVTDQRMGLSACSRAQAQMASALSLFQHCVGCTLDSVSCVLPQPAISGDLAWTQACGYGYVEDPASCNTVTVSSVGCFIAGSPTDPWYNDEATQDASDYVTAVAQHLDWRLSCSGGSGSSSSGQCDSDCDCGRCFFCDDGTCRYGGEGPAGCYRGCR